MARKSESNGEGVELYGLWPGGLPCVLVVQPRGHESPACLPLVVWTIEGEQQPFIEHAAERALSLN